MTDDLSASRERTRQLKEAVDAVDDFISQNCRNVEDSVAGALEGITKMSSKLRKAIAGEVWSEVKADRQLTEVRKLIQGVGGKLVEVDTENSGSAISVLDKVEKIIKPVLPSRRRVTPPSKVRYPSDVEMGIHDIYLWHVPGDYDDNSDWRVIYTLPISEEEFEKLVNERHAELENEIAVAEIMLS